MSKSGSRYGRRSNWFKIHCLLQDQGSSGVNTTQTFLGSNGSGLYPGLIHPAHYLTTENFLQSRIRGFPGQYGVQRDNPKIEDKRHSSTDESGGSSMEDVEEDASSRSASAMSFMRPPSSHKTPSPFSEKDPPSMRPYKVPSALPSSPLSVSTYPNFPSPLNHNFLPLPYLSPQTRHPYSFPATRPGLTPSSGLPIQLEHIPSPSWPHRTGGDLLLYSPAPGGIPLEQEEPIDLSVKSTASTPALTPPRASPEQKCHREDPTVDTPARDGRTTPLDLTKRSPEFFMDLPRENIVRRTP